jgi:iron complex transport system permease protein
VKTNNPLRRRGIVLPVSAIVMLALMFVVSLVGIVGFSPAEALDYLWQGVSGGDTNVIYWNLRLPRIVLCVLIGAVLSVSGATYQAVFRNPLTDPYVLGISSGASLGAAVAILLGLESSFFGVGLMALGTALITVLLIYKIASIGNRMHTATLLLTGVCFTFLATAVVSFLMVINQDKMDRIIFWTMGSFSTVAWSDVLILLPVAVLGIAVVLFHSRDLNLLLVGSETAKSLGVEVERVKKILLFCTTLMVAFAVSACGVIGFVGLVVPHCVRLVVGSDNRLIIPYSVVAGGIFLLLCDTLARTVLMPSEIPVGSVTALVGAPMFIYLLYKSKKRL